MRFFYVWIKIFPNGTEPFRLKWVRVWCTLLTNK